VVQDKIALFYWMREIAGLVFLIGLLVYIWSFFVAAREPGVTNEPATRIAEEPSGDEGAAAPAV
jgi:nitric oxide reductase subunit B